MKVGKQPGAHVWMALDSGKGAVGGAIPRAVLISLAKVWDTYDQPPRPQLFCGLDAGEGVDDYLASPAYPLERTHLIVSFGPLGSGTLQVTESEHEGIPRIHFSTADEILELNDSSSAARRLVQYEYRHRVNSYTLINILVCPC